MTDEPGGLLLDTCAVIWLANGQLPQPVVDAVMVAAISASTFISPVSAWEIGMLANPRGNRPALRFLPDPKAWFSKVMAAPGIRKAAMTPDIAVDASYLPGDLHGDSADRLLIATARHLRIPLVTRDTKIIEYAKQGFMQVVPC